MISESDLKGDLATARGLLFDYLATHRREDHEKLQARVREFVFKVESEKVTLRVNPVYGENYIPQLIDLYDQSLVECGPIEHWFDNEKRVHMVKVPKRAERWWRAWVT